MKILLRLIPILVLASLRAASFTEFYVQTDGSNLNSGDTNATTSLFTGASGNWTTNTTASTGTFFLSGADLSGVAEGRWASVYTNGVTMTGFIGRITAVNDTADTITVSTVAISGTNPGSSVGDMTCKVGGAWAGPGTGRASTNENYFPFDFVLATSTNSSGHTTRVNFKAGTTYSVTNKIWQTKAGPMWFQGYTSTAGDGGKAIIDGGTTGAAYVLFETTANSVGYADLIFDHNGDTGTSGDYGWAQTSGSKTMLKGVVVRNMKEQGFRLGALAIATECSAYGNGTSGFYFATSSGVVIQNCLSYNNVSHGYESSSSWATMINSIGASNAVDGLNANNAYFLLVGCDFYGNGDDGIQFGGNAETYELRNCNFVKNGGAGLATSGTAPIRHISHLLNCGFGTGSMTNSGGSIESGLSTAANQVGTVNYAADTTPWVDPANLDFRITSSEAKGDGRGYFTTNAVAVQLAWPDIGAAQHQEIASGGASSHTFVQ